MGADLPRLARRVADLAVDEGADTVVTYDADGIYCHPDHIAVHLVGRHAAALSGATLYEATVDREHLHFAGAHLLGQLHDPGRPADLRPHHGGDHVAVAATGGSWPSSGRRWPRTRARSRRCRDGT